MIPSAGREVIDGSISSPGSSLNSSTSKVSHGAALFGIFSFTLVRKTRFEAVGRALDPVKLSPR